MIYLPLSFLIFFILVLIFPLLVLMIHAGIVNIAFEKLGMSAGMAVFLFFSALIGSMVNIPLKKEKYYVKHYSFLGPPYITAEERVIAINLGGGIIPLCVSLYLLRITPLYLVVIPLIIMIVVSKFIAIPVEGVGITMPFFIPPLLSALLGWIFGGYHAPKVAYIAGTLGVLIGADLLNLSKLKKGSVLSIGGAGVFDGIFLTGVVAALLA